MSRRIIGVRRSASVEERIQPPLADLSALRLYPTSDVSDGTIVAVGFDGIYRYDLSATDAADDIFLVVPADGKGRWKLIAMKETYVRTDASSTPIITPGTAFVNNTIVWSTPVLMRDHREVTIWFQPTSLTGPVTEARLYFQWSDDGATIPLDSDNGLQQTDVLLPLNGDGTFTPVPYVPLLATADGSLATGPMPPITMPKKGGVLRFGVKATGSGGAFGARAQRLA